MFGLTFYDILLKAFTMSGSKYFTLCSRKSVSKSMVDGWVDMCTNIEIMYRVGESQKSGKYFLRVPFTIQTTKENWMPFLISIFGTIFRLTQLLL